LQRDLAARGRPFVADHYDRGSLAERYLAILEDVAPGARSVSAPARR
jgi:hypothetical protein